MIAALFVATGGCYFGLDGVDPWDEQRDARNYPGPYPVVAHPPCQLWTNMARVNFKRWGGEHNRPGNDGGCFASALASVRAFGGVLEHPAGSHAWAAHGLVPPDAPGWTPGVGSHEFVCEVWQSAYGHKARKRTWLYYVGPTPPELNWSREPGSHQIGWFDRKKPTLSKREALATPLPFRDLLLGLAHRDGRQPGRLVLRAPRPAGEVLDPRHEGRRVKLRDYQQLAPAEWCRWCEGMRSRRARELKRDLWEE